MKPASFPSAHLLMRTEDIGFDDGAELCALRRNIKKHKELKQKEAQVRCYTP